MPEISQVFERSFGSLLVWLMAGTRVLSFFARWIWPLNNIIVGISVPIVACFIFPL
jgi:hypothetical protein